MKKLLSITLSLLMSISLCCTITADEGTDNNGDDSTPAGQVENVEEKQEIEVVTDNKEDGSGEVDEQKQDEVTTPAQPADSGVSKDETSTENKETIDSETTKDESKGTETIPAVSEEHEGEGSGEVEETPSTLDTEKTDDEIKDSEDLTEVKEETVIDLNTLSSDELFEYLMANVKDDDQLDALYDEYPNLNDLLSKLSDEQVDEFFAMLYGDGSNELPSNGEDDITLANEEVKEEKTVATIGGKTYTDLNTAITEAKDGQNIVLQDDISIDTINVSGKKTITLDANGKTINQDFSSYNDVNSYQRLINVSSGANLIIKGNGKFIGPTSSDDGKKYDGKSLIKVNDEGSKITIEDGEFTVTAGSGKQGMYGIFASNGATVELGVNGTNNGPTIHSFFAVVGQNNIASPSSTITIYGGNYTADVTQDTAKFCAAIFASATGSVSIYGGTFNGYYAISSPYANVTQNITISGGTFNATNSTKLALFVGNEKGSGEAGTGTRTISITGGTFSSDVSAYLATDYNIAKVNDVYKVTKNGETLPVETITPAVAEGTTETIKTSKEIKGKDSTGVDATVTVNDNTQIVLASESKTLDETEVKQVEAVKKQVETIITDASKQELKYIPLDITLTAINGGAKTKITDLGKTEQNNDVEITVTLYLNDANAKALKDKEVKVIRIHKNTDGGSEIAVLGAKLTGNALTFTTGKFSTYVIAYAETKPTPTTSPETTETKQETIKSYDAKDKNKDGVISCQEEMNSANWTWSETKKACVYRVTNTSAK